MSESVGVVRRARHLGQALSQRGTQAEVSTRARANLLSDDGKVYRNGVLQPELVAVLQAVTILSIRDEDEG